MDTNVKKRGWVKNAVIIFLSIMLVLTFFSNTIMNRSLPQVATQYVTGGSISARIRGTGTVTANAPYEVTFNEGRKVQSVQVKVGDRVEVGDVLITLTEDANSELEEAAAALEEMTYNYQVFLLNMASADYTRENRDIRRQKEAVAELEKELAGLAVSEGELAAVKIAVNAAQTRVEKAQDALDEAQQALDAYNESHPGGDSDYDTLYKAYIDADTAFKAKCLLYAKDYNRFFGAAGRWRTKDGFAFQLPAYLSALYEVITGSSSPEIDVLVYLNDLGDSRIEPIDTKDWGISIDYYDKETILAAIEDEDWFDLGGTSSSGTPGEGEGEGDVEPDVGPSEYQRFAAAFSEIQTAGNTLTAATEALAAAGSSAAMATQRAALEAAVKEAGKVLAEAQKELEAAQKEQENIEGRVAEYGAKKQELAAARTALEDAVFNLSEEQKSDNKQAAKDKLELDRMKKALEEQEALVEKLSSGDVKYEITAKAAGVISSINVVAGRTFQPEEVLMTIDQTDRGYTLSFPVSNEQARRVHVGDTAEASTSSWWFDGVINATLTGIANNPSDPRNSRMLIFTVTGDVESGQSLTVTIGERSQNYELVVPKSAIRSDSNGSYVLLLEQRPSALNNRYYATRIDVEILASDDTQSAVSGSLSQWDYVITSASMPVDAGQQVRLTES